MSVRRRYFQYDPEARQYSVPVAHIADHPRRWGWSGLHESWQCDDLVPLSHGGLEIEIDNVESISTRQTVGAHLFHQLYRAG